MRLFTIPVCVRLNIETINDVKDLLERYSEYNSFSHVIRCAVIRLINETNEEEENENRRIKNKRK